MSSSNATIASTSTQPAAPQAQAAPPVPPMRRVSQLIIGLWVPQAVHAAAELGIADVLAHGPRSSADVAAALGTHADSTDRLLLALATLGLLEVREQDRFALTETGECLVDTAQTSVRAWARLMGGAAVWDAWGRLAECVRTGRTAWDLRAAAKAASDAGDAHADPFASMSSDPEAAAVFNRAMYDLTRGAAPGIVSAIDWAGVRTAIDVGGGYGALLCALLEAQPAINGAVFDLPHARDGAQQFFAVRGVSDRASYIEGSLFTDALPPADAYIIKSVIHDWDDAKSIEILRACRRAMTATAHAHAHPNGSARLLMVEPPAMPGGTNPMLDWMIAFSDLNMLVNCGGRERTEAEYRALLDAAGLRTVAVHPTSGFYRVFEAVSDS